MLEKHFIESVEFAELNEENFTAYSNGHASLIQTIGSELDTVFKEFCGFKTTEKRTIEDYSRSIIADNPDIINQIIYLREHDLEI